MRQIDGGLGCLSFTCVDYDRVEVAVNIQNQPKVGHREAAFHRVSGTSQVAKSISAIDSEMNDLGDHSPALWLL